MYCSNSLAWDKGAIRRATSAGMDEVPYVIEHRSRKADCRDMTERLLFDREVDRQ
jgi:hypothetical protein